MKSMINYLIVTCLLLWGLSSPLMAEDIYVSGVTKITMRTGPGTEHKIVAMLTSGTKLEILEYQKDWSNVRTDTDKRGWVLSRFLTREVPRALLVKQLQMENQELIAARDHAQARAVELKAENDSLAGIQKKYKQLEQASADYLKLETAYQELAEKSKAQQEQILSLEQKVDNEELLWALSGAGVFIIGLIIGLATRKKKRHSLLS